MAIAVPIQDGISLDALYDDPFPFFRQMSEKSPVTWVPSTNLNLVTGFEEIMEIERNSTIYTSTNPTSLMNQVLGRSLMRKDGEPHALERKAIEPSFRPGVVKNHWSVIFAAIADQLITGFEKDGSTDLFQNFAAPMASLSLIEMLGFKDVAWQDIAYWSQSLMDAMSNYGGSGDARQRGRDASAAIDAAIDAVVPIYQVTPNPSIISSMLHADSPQSIEQIRSNVKVIIGGGLNEPRDSILTATYGLLSNPQQQAKAIESDALWGAVFEEAIRWVAPICMYPRRVDSDVVLGGVQLRQGDQLGVCVAAANRDPSRFEQPDEFNIFRKKQSHLGFGAGPHFCAGTWVARQMVGAIAVPQLFARLKDLRLDENKKAKFGGWVFRGPLTLPVQWTV